MARGTAHPGRGGAPRGAAAGGAAPAPVQIETYFGFFAESIFKALQSSLTQQTGTPIAYEGLQLSQTNTLKLRWSEVETVLLPELVIAGDIPFVIALDQRDVQVLSELAQRRVSLQRMMEQAVSTALEPFNFITKRRNRLSAMQFSRNVTGLTAHHLEGEIVYTMATGRFRVRGQTEFALRLLVTPRGRDRIEERATARHTQRALFSIIEGGYVCRPQWEPPPPPPAAEAAGRLSRVLTGAWMQSFFQRNDGPRAPRIFGEPVAFTSEEAAPADLEGLRGEPRPLTVARLVLNQDKALETFVVLTEPTAAELLRLSKSADVRFTGELFRVLFSEAARVWEAFTGQALRWRALAVRRIPPESIDAVSSRLAGGGVVLRQWARLSEGRVGWWLAASPHTWHRLMRLTAASMDLRSGESPHREAIFHATGWGQGTIPWRQVFGFLGERDLQILVRQLDALKLEPGDFAAIARALAHGDRDRWHEAMPVRMEEKVAAYRLVPGEAVRRQLAVTRAMIDLNRRGRIPEGRLAEWLKLYTEFQWHRRQALIDELLPLRHLIYGLDRTSLSRLLYDEKNAVLEDMLADAEFMVVDQVRRAITPGFAMRLLENVAHKRPRTSAFACQQARVGFYRRALDGLGKGRYLIRETPAKRLRELVQWLDEPR